LWWNRDQQAASPEHLVLHLPAKLSPPLVEDALEDGLVESGFLLDVPTGLFDRAGGRSGHIALLEILHHNHRVVFADGVRSLMQEVPASVGNAGVNALNSGLRCAAC
jgi:hypothetical protein